MAFQWYQTDPLGASSQATQQQPPPGYGPIYYSRSAPSSPYAQPVLLPTPPVAVSPLPGQVWLPYGYSPGTAPIPLQRSPGAPPIPAAPVLLDVLNPSTSWRHQTAPHIQYDIRDYPQRALVNTPAGAALLSQSHLGASITSPATTSIKVISKLFPWEIDVQSANSNTPVTVEDLIIAVHDALDKHITGSEWWIVTEDVRTKVSAQYLKNCDRSSTGEGRHKGEVEKPRHKKEGLRRVDWLLDNFVMKGLEKDEAFSSTRIRDKDIRDQTWVLVTGPK